MTTRPARCVLAVAAALTLLTGCASPAGSTVDRAEPPLAVDEELRGLLPVEVRDAGVLTVATDASYPPASSFAVDGRTIVGFEPDLLARMSELLGVRVEFRLWDFDAMLDDLDRREFDLVMSAMTDTAEREERADFVNYFRAGTSILVQRGNPQGIHDLTGLCGEAVAVEAGTVQVDLLERSQERCGGSPIDVQSHPTNDDALVELRTGRVAAVVTDYPPAVFVTTDERTQGAFQLVSDVQYEPGLYGIAVARDRTGLRDAVTGALTELVDTGAYADVLADWKVSSGAVSVVTVNGGGPAAP